MIKYFCDWCNEEQWEEKSLRTIEFLISKDRICLDCCKQVSKVRFKIKQGKN